MPSDRTTEAVHYNVFNKTICVYVTVILTVAVVTYLKMNKKLKI